MGNDILLHKGHQYFSIEVPTAPVANSARPSENVVIVISHIQPGTLYRWIKLITVVNNYTSLIPLLPSLFIFYNDNALDTCRASCKSMQQVYLAIIIPQRA